MSYTPEELIDYLLDELPSERRSQIEALLQTDGAAREELERQRGLLQAVGGLPEEDPPRRLSFVPMEVPPTSLVRLRRPIPRLLAMAAAIVLAVAAGIWAGNPTLDRHASGWTLAFGAPAGSPATATDAQLRQVLREELALSESRWRKALLEAAQTAARADWTRSEFEALRREIAETHEDSVAAFDFLNAKHELLKRQLLEFEMASFEEVLP